VEQFVHAGYDLEAAAILLCEVRRHARRRSRRDRPHEGGARRGRRDALTVSRDEAERLRFWSGRKAAFPAVGRISPDYYCMDGTIPKKKLGEVLNFIAAMEKKYGLRCPNVFHAGDGNLHPLILFDANDPEQLQRTEAFAGEVLDEMRRGGRHHHRRARRGRGEDRPDVRAVRPRELETSTPSSGCSIRKAAQPGKAVPRCTAAPSSAACT
jgi:glycolate oxidase